MLLTLCRSSLSGASGRHPKVGCVLWPEEHRVVHCGEGHFLLGIHAELCMGDFSPTSDVEHVEFQSELCSMKNEGWKGSQWDIYCLLLT